MIVAWMLGVIGIVKPGVFSEIHFTDEPAFGQERQRPIDSGAGDRFIPFPGPFQEFFGGKMTAGAEGRIDNSATLGGQP
jgi:hypothetical protein